MYLYTHMYIHTKIEKKSKSDGGDWGGEKEKKAEFEEQVFPPVPNGKHKHKFCANSFWPKKKKEI